LKSFKWAIPFSIGTIATIIFVEIFFQLAEVELPYHELSPTLGKSLQPSKRIMMLKDGFYMGRVNRYGYIGPAYPRERAPDTYRIALIGDSYTEGFHVFERYHFRSVLEHELNKHTDLKVEVLNFGMGGFNLQDMYVYQTNFARAFAPDLVILTAQIQDFGHRTNFVPGPRPQLRGEMLTLNYDFTHEPTFSAYAANKYFVDHSAYLKLMNNAYKLASRGDAPSILFDKLYTKHDGEPSESASENWDRPINRAILTALRKDNVMLVLNGSFPRSFLEHVRQAGFPVLELDPIMVALRRQGVEPRYWKATGRMGHWNHEGQFAVGTAMASTVRRHFF
jgi:hypothetical protein